MTITLVNLYLKYLQYKQYKRGEWAYSNIPLANLRSVGITDLNNLFQTNTSEYPNWNPTVIRPSIW